MTPETIFGERMTRIEMDVKYIKEGMAEDKKQHIIINENLEAIKTKVEEFVLSANKTYATKKEVKEVQDNILRKRDINRSWVQWLPSVVTAVIAVIAIIW